MPTSLETRPWFVDNLAETIRGVYMAAYPRRGVDVDYWRGVVSIVVSILIAVGSDPMKVLTPEDVELVREMYGWKK